LIASDAVKFKILERVVSLRTWIFMLLCMSQKMTALTPKNICELYQKVSQTERSK